MDIHSSTLPFDNVGHSSDQNAFGSVQQGQTMALIEYFQFVKVRLLKALEAGGTAESSLLQLLGVTLQTVPGQPSEGWGYRKIQTRY